MNLSEHATGMTSSWIERFTEKLGSEDKFTTYIDNVYKLLDNLKVDEQLHVEKWCKPENYELFIKLATCYVSTSQCCYSFNPEYTIIKRDFDAREMEKKLALFADKRKAKIIGTDGSGTERDRKGLEAVSTPASPV